MKRVVSAVAAAVMLSAIAPAVPLASAETVVRTWTQTSQTDFLQGISDNVDLYSSPGNVVMGGVDVSLDKARWRTDFGGDLFSRQGSPYLVNGEGSFYGGRYVGDWCNGCRYQDYVSTPTTGKDSITVYLLPSSMYSRGYYNGFNRLYLRITDGDYTQDTLLRSLEISWWDSYRENYGSYSEYTNVNGWGWYKFVVNVPSHFNRANLRTGLFTDSYTSGIWSCSCYQYMYNYVAFGVATAATFTSNVHDAGGLARFDQITFSGTLPAETTLRVETRTSVDRAAWTTWERALSGEPLPNSAGRFVQYRTFFTRPSVASPVLEEVRVSYSITTDTTAPRTTGSASGRLGCSGWLVTSPTVTLRATDDISGVRETLVSVDGGFSTAYAGPFGLGDGEHTVDYYSSDHSGNVEASRALTVKVDAAAPSTDASAPGAIVGGSFFARPDAVVSLSASDSASGVKVTRVDAGSGLVAYAGPFRLGEGDGARTLRFASEDRACNVEPTRALSLVVDGSAPVTTARVTGVSGCSGWFVTTPVVDFTAADAGSGVARTLVSVDGGAFQPHAGPIALADGARSVSYFSVDRVGNAEAARTISLQVDTAAPTTVASIGGPSFAGGRLYVSPSTPFSLAASDATSGVASTVVDTGDGPRSIAYWSEDAACNAGRARSISAFVDGTPPEVAILKPSGVTALGQESDDVEAATAAQCSLAERGIHGRDADRLSDIVMLGAHELCDPAAAARCASLALAELAPRMGGAIVVGPVTVEAYARDPDVNGGSSGLAYVAFYLDGLIVAVDVAAPFAWEWDAANASMGRHDVGVLAVDRLGNAASAASGVSVVPVGVPGAFATGEGVLEKADAPLFSRALYAFVREKTEAARPPDPPTPPNLPPVERPDPSVLDPIVGGAPQPPPGKVPSIPGVDVEDVDVPDGVPPPPPTLPDLDDATSLVPAIPPPPTLPPVCVDDTCIAPG